MSIAESARRLKRIRFALRSARTWTRLFEVSRTINDEGLLEHDRMRAWDEYAHNVSRLRGSGWQRDFNNPNVPVGYGTGPAMLW